MYAYYSKGGSLVAVARNILSDHLPLHLLLCLKTQFQHCWITELFEMDTDNATVYYITLENANDKIKLRSTPDFNWEAYSVSKKQ